MTRPGLVDDLAQVSARLTAWFAAKLGRPDLAVIEIRPMTGGLVNTIHVVTLAAATGESERRFVLRWDPITGPQEPYDMVGQFATYERLRRTAIPVPEPLWLETDLAVIGRSFWVSEFIEADAVGRLLDPGDALHDARMEAYVGMLSEIHAADWRAAGIDAVRPTVAAEALGRLVGEEDPWLALTPDEDRGTFARAKDYLTSRRPADFALSLTHGDCSANNYLFRGARIVGVIDWDLSIITDRARDVAFHCALIYRFDPAESPCAKATRRADFIALYERTANVRLTTLPYWEVYTNYHNALSWLRPGWATHINGYCGYRDRLATLVR